MEVFERGERQQIVLTTLLGVFVGAVVFFAVLAMAQAGNLNEGDAAATVTVELWSLRLMQVVKSPLKGGGFSMTLEALTGLFTYASIWTIAGVATAIVRLRLVDRHADVGH